MLSEPSFEQLGPGIYAKYHHKSLSIFRFSVSCFYRVKSVSIFRFSVFYSVKWFLLFSIYRDFTWYLPGRSKLSCLIYILFTEKYLRYIYMLLPLGPLNFTGLSPFLHVLLLIFAVAVFTVFLQKLLTSCKRPFTVICSWFTYLIITY